MRQRPHEDSGLTLIELVVVVLLLGILGGAAATILANAWRAQNDVTTLSQATTRGQLISQSIERAVRNSIDINPDTNGGTMLRVHTSFSGSRECQAFWFTGNAVYMTQSAGPLPAAVLSAWPNTWQSGVVQHGSAPFIVWDDANRAVKYTFDITTAAAPVSFAGDAAMRSTPVAEDGTCW